MAYRGRPRKAKDNGNANGAKLTALWPTKRQGLWVGTVKEIEALISVVKEAKNASKGVTFFLWENNNSKFPGDFNLTANVERDNPNPIRNNGGKVEDDPEEEEEEEVDDL